MEIRKKPVALWFCFLSVSIMATLLHAQDSLDDLRLFYTADERSDLTESEVNNVQARSAENQKITTGVKVVLQQPETAKKRKSRSPKKEVIEFSAVITFGNTVSIIVNDLPCVEFSKGKTVSSQAISCSHVQEAEFQFELNHESPRLSISMGNKKLGDLLIGEQL